MPSPNPLASYVMRLLSSKRDCHGCGRRKSGGVWQLWWQLWRRLAAVNESPFGARHRKKAQKHVFTALDEFTNHLILTNIYNQQTPKNLLTVIHPKALREAQSSHGSAAPPLWLLETGHWTPGRRTNNGRKLGKAKESSDCGLRTASENTSSNS